MHSSTRDDSVARAGCLPSIYRLPNFTGATAPEAQGSSSSLLTREHQAALQIGERCNVAGSIMYKKAIVDGNYDKAAAIALKQARFPSLPHPL